MDEHEPMHNDISDATVQRPPEAAIVEELDQGAESLDEDRERIEEIKTIMLKAVRAASEICESSNLRGPNDINVIALKIYDRLWADFVNEKLRDSNKQTIAFQ
jgi:hypothetical protein